jgi:hypothetical protein
MLDLLFAIAVLLPAWYAYRRSVARGMVAINHVTTFTFGFLVYWITPMLAGVYGSRFASQLSSVYFSFFTERFVVPYLAVCIGLYLCFMIGDSLGARLFHYSEARTASITPKVALSLVTAAGCVLALYTSYTLRAELLLPYSTRLTFKTARGTLTSCVVLLGVVALIFTLDRPRIPWRKRLSSRYILPFLAGCMAFLWMGTRLYFVSFFVMLAVYQSNFQKRLKLTTVLLGMIGLVAVSGAVAILRSHGEIHKIADATISLFQEPVLTSLSLVHYLGGRHIAWTNSPVYLASDFSNLIPALILPEKAVLRKRMPVYNPLGAVHSFVSFNLNFGVLGTAAFLFLLAIGFRYLKSRSSSTLFATMYIMCSGWMAFTFFRDAFFISLVKTIVQDSILLPIAIIALGRLLSAACVPVGQTATSPTAEVGGASWTSG